MAHKVLRQQRNRKGSLSRCFLLACVLLATPPLVCAEILQNLHYLYDNAGNVTRIGDQITLPNTQTLTYDDLDRLDVATGNYGIFDFNYDAIGNLVVNPQLGAGINTYAYRPDGVRPHAVCAIGAPGVACPSIDPPYDYDANGNLVKGDGRTYTWNMENKPTSMTSGAAPSSGLVAAYGFNEGTGTTVADTSGTNTPATLTNVAWTTQGKYGAGLTFNGTNSYGMIPPPTTALRLTNAVTVEAWIKPAALPAGWGDLVTRQFSTASNGVNWGLVTHGTTVEFWGGNTDFVSGGALTVGQWYHVAGVLDGTTLRLYINGSLISTNAITTPIPSDDNEVIIGAADFGTLNIQEFFNGTIDEVRIYNRALSQAEIQTDMNTPISPPGLAAAYGFNEGAGTEVADTSGVNRPATLTNVAWTTQGKYGAGLTFNGTSSYGMIPSPASALRFTNAMTIEVWFKATTLPTGWRNLISRQFGTGTGDGWGMGPHNSNVAFWTGNDFIEAPITVGQWYHVAGVLDGTTLRLYLNGALVATGTATIPISNDDNEVVIGAGSNGNPLISEYFNGTLDEMRVYNRALSQSEIQTDMNTPIPSLTTTAFVYDGDGGRVKKTVGTTTTRYISQLYECENSNCSRYIWAGDTRIAIVPDNPTGQPCNPACYFNDDHLSSTNLVTGPTGARVETITYRPYGDIHSDSPGTPVNTPYKYTGQERDASTGLLYYNARYYDPRLGRFISADSVVSSSDDPQSLNRYSYARNNPLLYTDPSGHIFGIDDLIIVAIVIGATVGAVSSGIQSDWDLQATLLGGVIGGVSAGVGFGTFGPASAAFASLGDIGSGIAGGAVAGAVAGGTSGALAMAAGYKVNIGLAIASGAAAGGIVGGAGAFGAQFGQGTLAAFAAAPAAGASAAAISGSDPGIGAAIAAATAAFALGVQQAYEVYKQYAAAQGAEGSQPSIATRAGYNPQAGGCAGRCNKVSAHILTRPDTTPRQGLYNPYDFDVLVNNPEGAGLSVVYQTPYEIRPITNFTTMGGLNISGGTISLRAFTFALERISLNYRSDVMIHVYGERGQIGYFDVPLNYQGSQFGAPAH